GLVRRLQGIDGCRPPGAVRVCPEDVTVEAVADLADGRPGEQRRRPQVLRQHVAHQVPDVPFRVGGAPLPLIVTDLADTRAEPLHASPQQHWYFHFSSPCLFLRLSCRTILRSAGGCQRVSRRCTRARVSRRLASEVASYASGSGSQRSGASGASARAAPGAWVARTNRRSACSCAGSSPAAGTPTTATCRSCPSGQGVRSASPVSSAASLSAMASGSLSPGSPCPPTCSHACCRRCQRSSTRRLSGCTISADAVRCSGSERSHGSAAVRTSSF